MNQETFWFDFIFSWVSYINYKRTNHLSCLYQPSLNCNGVLFIFYSCSCICSNIAKALVPSHLYVLSIWKHIFFLSTWTPISSKVSEKPEKFTLCFWILQHCTLSVEACVTPPNFHLFPLCTLREKKEQVPSSWSCLKLSKVTCCCALKRQVAYDP